MDSVSRTEPQIATATRRSDEAGRRNREARSAARSAERGAQRRSREAEEAAALGNTRIVLPGDPDWRNSALERRYNVRRVIQQVTEGKHRVTECGWVPHGPRVSLRCSGDGERPGFAGVKTCGSVWACPVCAAKIAARRTAELQAVLAKAEREEYRASMVTLTMRHHWGQDLKDLWAGLGYAWGRVTSGRGWNRLREELGLIGWARAVEVTHGANGWHVHIHAVFVTERAPDVERHGPVLFERWKRGLEKNGLESVMNSGGFSWDVADPKNGKGFGKYVAKLGKAEDLPAARAQVVNGMAAEATLGAYKRARAENRTPFQIAEDIGTFGDYQDVAIWREYVEVSRGKRALTWSRTLREFSQLGKEQTDEEIAAEEIGDDAIAVFTAKQWRKAREYAGAILHVLRTRGKRATFELMGALGLQWLPTEQSADFVDFMRPPPDYGPPLGGSFHVEDGERPCPFDEGV